MAKIRWRWNYDRLFVLGRSGSGKSTLVASMIRAARAPYLVFAPDATDARKGLYSPDRVATFSGREPLDDLDDFIIEAFKHAPITIVIEDLPAIFYRNEVTSVFRNALLTARKFGVGFIFVTQKLKGVPTIIPASCNKMFVSNVDDTREIDVIRSFDISHLERLNKFEFLYVDRETGELAVVNTERLK